jgi:hypothetical protein
MGKVAKLSKKNITTKGVKAKKIRVKYEGGVLLLTKKNLRMLNDTLATADTRDMDETDRKELKRASNKVLKEYRKYQKSLPKEKRDNTVHA